MQLESDASQQPTAFEQQCTFKLRWFTPAIEVPLCGHATLASAAILFTGKVSATFDLVLACAASMTSSMHSTQQPDLLLLQLYSVCNA